MTTTAIRITDGDRVAWKARQGQPHPIRLSAWRMVYRLRARERFEHGDVVDSYTDLTALQERVRYLRQLGEQGRHQRLCEAITAELFLIPEETWQHEMFLQALRVRLDRQGCDLIKIVRMRYHVDCARFGELQRIFRSFDLIQLTTELHTLEFISSDTRERC